MRFVAVVAAIMILVTWSPPVAGADPPIGFLETWSGTSTNGWTGGASVTNPGSGGVDGAADGFLRVATLTVGKLGSRSSGAPYVGDWIAAGITRVRFSVKDIGADDALEIHFGIGNGNNFWQCNTPVLPPENSWAEVTLDITVAANFTQIAGSGTFDQALHNVDRILFRHDIAPYGHSPNTIMGDFGIDNLLLGNAQTPVLATTWGRIKALYR